MSVKDRSIDDLKKELQLLQRQQRIVDARNGMLAFGHFMKPDTEDPNDAEKSEYQVSAPAKVLCGLLEEVEQGKKKRVAVSIAPQTGKTLNLSLLGPAWILGRNPKAKIAIVSYSATRAEEIGKELMDILESPQYRQVFPDFKPDPGAWSRSHLQNTKGGRILLRGVGGAITGNTADYLFIDDPIKGEDDESDLTPTALERLWAWFFKVAYSRGSKRTRILIVHTRWAEDDLIGRLCDPNHPERNKRFRGIAEDWFYLNLSAIIKDTSLAELLGLELKVSAEPRVIEMFGIEPMETLWPESKDLAFYAEWKRGDPRSFSALAMGSPAPDDGAYFLKDWLVEYNSMEAIPSNLRIYGASDHAVSLKQGRDSTVIGKIGLDEFDNIWLLPDLVWDKMETDRTVEELCVSMTHSRWKPILWWLEDENIKKAFGPFLVKRMHELKIYSTVLSGIRPAADKKTRARSTQGRMAMKKFRFPAFAPWWPDAKAQLLRFPYAAHDDFVDFLSLFGMGLLHEFASDPAQKEATSNGNVIQVGSIQWILAETKRKAEKEKMAVMAGGW